MYRRSAQYACPGTGFLWGGPWRPFGGEVLKTLMTGFIGLGPGPGGLCRLLVPPGLWDLPCCWYLGPGDWDLPPGLPGPGLMGLPGPGDAGRPPYGLMGRLPMGDWGLPPGPADVRGRLGESGRG